MNAINRPHRFATSTLSTVTSIAEFEGLKNDWEALTKSPLRSFAWNFAWWKNFQHLGELKLFVLTVQDCVVGIAPFFEDKWLGQKRLRFIGSGKTCTDYTGLIVSDLWHDQFVQLIQAEIEGQIALVELEGVSVDDALADLRGQVANSFWRESEAMDPTWILDLPEDWAEFKAGSKKSLRRKIKKAEKRLASDQFEVLSTLDGNLSIEDGWNLLVELHQVRFESKGEDGAFSDPAFTAFLQEAFEELSKDGRAEIIAGYCDGEPIGVQLYFFTEEGPQLYQAGIQVKKIDCEPGHLLISYAVHKSIERGYQLFDFLRGTESYKPYWGAVPSTIQKVQYVSRSVVPSTVVGGYHAIRKLRKKIKPTKES